MLKLVKELFSWVATIFLAILIIFFVNSEIFAMVQVEQQSMESTLHAGERLYVDRLGWQLSGPQRGKIIIFLPEREIDSFWAGVNLFIDDYVSVFKRQQAPRRFVKRIIALPGDEVDIEEGKLIVNGEVQIEPYAVGETYTAEIEFPLVVPEGELFVLGDNRLVSRDSRSFGTIAQDSVIGTAVFRVAPFDKAGPLKP